MRYNIYQTKVVIDCESTDIDGCPCNESETIFDDMFSSKKEAIRMAQSTFDRQPLNNYVHSVWSAVYRIAIEEKGTGNMRRIYNKFKYND